MENNLEAVVVGAGLSGLGMAARLRRSGVTSFVVLERADSHGGTWRDNVYPGAACDVQSHVYWYSFGYRPDWSRTYATQPEILAAIEHFVDTEDLAPHIRYGAEVTDATWSDVDARWAVRTAAGQVFRARALITAWGQLSTPTLPDIDGTFRGATVHTARWQPDLDVTGKRVACVGSAASAVQLVPAVSETARSVTVFQRTPNWLLPRDDQAYGDDERRQLMANPAAYDAHRSSMYRARDAWAAGVRLDGNPMREQFRQVSMDLLATQVPDPVLREKLTPDYEFACRRVLVSDDYYPALMRDNVELVTEPIARIEPEGVRTTDGQLHEVDVVVHATGFAPLVSCGGVDIVGNGPTLREAWRNGAEAYLGITVASFPNLFLLYGPNTNLAHHSILEMVECQIEYVLQMLAALRARGGASSIEVRPEVQRRFNTELQRDLAGTSFTSNCGSWWKDAGGKVVANWSSDVESYRKRTASFDPADFVLRTR